MNCIVCNKSFHADSHKILTCSDECRTQNKKNIKNEWYQRNEHKNAEYYQKNKGRLRKYNESYQKLNKEQIRERQKKYREKNRDKINQRAREYSKRVRNTVAKNTNLKKSFGINLDQYNEMLESQKGLCKICGNPETAKTRQGLLKKLAVDHCHTSNKVRGLLCTRCNTAVGLVKENLNTLYNMINYLKEHNHEDDE